jgi:DNA-binding NtrC family response regulator
MMNVLLVAGDARGLAQFEAALKAMQNVVVKQVASAGEATEALESGWAAVVVFAADLADGPALPAVKRVMKRFPLINCAMVSPLPAAEFHEATEGLGLFMQLPVDPGAADAARMVALLDKINTLLGSETKGVLR